MRLFDTYTRSLVELPPPPGPIRMYFCGPTVYQRIHTGNARPFVISLWLKRWLEESGYEVRLAENITDINDKIYDAARQQGIPSAQLAADASRWYVDDTDLLGLGRPDVEPQATDSVGEIVALIGRLVDGGLAYPAAGDVYFRVAAFPDYGKLSGREDEESLHNPSEEPERAELKEDPRDFALWKGQKEGEDTSWESPWGRGRPGWHIECSAMASAHLGPVFEIHGGGNDLIFPHHENEIAQSRGVGDDFAQLWMHNGMLELTGEKMSKSVGNIVSLRDVLLAGEYGAEHRPLDRETVLMLFLRAHWRQPVEFSKMTMGQSFGQVMTFVNAFQNQAPPAQGPPWEVFEGALNDDFNTPRALAVLHEWAHVRDKELLKRGLEVFGLATLAESMRAPPDVYELAEQRQSARAGRDFDEADRLRTEIESRGWEVRDVDDGFQLVPR